MNMVHHQCEVCYNAFDAEIHVPKFLTCGHTLCVKCLTNVLKESLKSCPKCRATLNDIYVDNYVTNYALINNLEETSAVESKEVSDFKNLLLVHKRKLASSSEMVENLKILVDNKLKNRNISKNDCPKFEKEITENMLKIVTKLRPVTLNPTILKISDYDLNDQLFTGNKEIYAVVQLGQEKRYGQVLKVYNKIFLCSLTDSSVPEAAIVFEYADLMKEYPVANVFLTIPCDEMNSMTLVFRTSENDHKFIGTLGFAYKGMDFCHKTGEGNISANRSSKELLTLNLKCENVSNFNFTGDNFKTTEFIGCLEIDLDVKLVDSKVGCSFNILKILPNLKLGYKNEMNIGENYSNKVLESGLVLEFKK